MDPKLKAQLLNDLGAAIEGDTLGGLEVEASELANEFNDVTLLVTTPAAIYRLTLTLVTPLSQLDKTETQTKIG